MAFQSTQKVSTKTLAWVVAIIGVGALGFGAYGIQQQIIGPYSFNTFQNTGDIVPLVIQTEEQEIDELKMLDTDNDSLSDYDEIYVYSTSPYLPDTDSDGFTDAFEVREGSDPNCLPGGNCLGIRIVTPETKISDLFPQFSDSDITLKDKTVQEFRAILLEQGFDPEDLAQIDDDSLLVILEESLKVQEGLDEQLDEDIPDEVIDYDEVRLFLIDLGVPEDEVYSLSNNQVRDILESLQ